MVFPSPTLKVLPGVLLLMYLMYKYIFFGVILVDKIKSISYIEPFSCSQKQPCNDLLVPAPSSPWQALEMWGRSGLQSPQRCSLLAGLGVHRGEGGGAGKGVVGHRQWLLGPSPAAHSCGDGDCSFLSWGSSRGVMVGNCRPAMSVGLLRALWIRSLPQLLIELS